ncbi:efflux transporter outer membrane subunit [Pontibacter indicus]|uniref:Efflux transporter, outer membrane factor (OMF) lipoprotein, NodT family n=1 Tax=Pontibacter indicus TaxID=1317125 RepID=A0A1R3X356_9BACT|nr:efflux transporter outer membrane subunit [Pontibacter indicus]SIT83775.1 efflux transporter, outer membrane factor (OMF) lipoprotein, NodT family [Pontibacter indicus]
MHLHRSLLKTIPCLALLVLLGACKAIEPTQLPDAAPLPASFGSTADSASLGDVRWRDFFKDEHLVRLIDTALHNNPDVLAAAQRIELARAGVLQTRGELLPQVSAVGAAGVDRFGKYTMTGVGNFDTNLSPNISEDQKVNQPLVPEYFLGLRSSWEIDLWGKLRQGRKAAFARFMASEKGRQLVTTSLVADVANLYYQLLSLDNELAILDRNIALQERALELVCIQKEGGRATELAVKQFAAQLLNTQALKAEKTQEITQTENQLNRLLGRHPQPIARGAALVEQELPQQVHAGVPSDLLRRRPDIQQAELELLATKADVAAARAAFLPALTLNPYVGYNAFDASLLFKPASLAYGVLGGLSAPLLNRSNIRADFRRADAGRLQAFAAYQSAVLTGVQEVMTNLRGIENFRQSAELKQEEVEVLQEAVGTANDLYAAGYASYLEIITAQRSVLEAELHLTNTRKNILQSTVGLYRALGGGWQE